MPVKKNYVLSCLKMSPLIPFIRKIISEFSDIAFHPLRISRFELVKVVLCPRMTFYTCLIFDEILLVNCTHYNIYLTRSGIYPHHQCVT